jgi:hypothetical protein
MHALNEPIVTINLTVGCTSRVSRQFVAFPRSAMLNLAQADESTSPAIEPSTRAERARRSPVCDGAGTACRPNRASRRRPTARNRSARAPDEAWPPLHREALDPVLDADSAPDGAEPDARRAPASPARPLLPSPAGHARLPSLKRPHAARPCQIAAAASAASLAAADLPLAPVQPAINPELEQLKLQLAQERERVRTLEASLARLRSDAEANQKRTLTAAVPVAVAKPEPARAASPMLYPLVGFGALLAAAIAIAAWRPKKKAFGTSRWWDLTQQPSSGKSDATPSRFDSIRSESEDLRAQLPPRVASALASSRLGEPTSPPIGGLEVTTVAAQARRSFSHRPDTLPASLVESTPAAVAPSMEVLIDLEQEAEFFTVIGQDEAAVALLSKHIQREGPISPLPFLKLLEIHRRRNDTAGHRAVGDAFRARFSTPPPAWDAPGGGPFARRVSVDAGRPAIALVVAPSGDAGPRSLALPTRARRRDVRSRRLPGPAVSLCGCARSGRHGGDVDVELDLVCRSTIRRSMCTCPSCRQRRVSRCSSRGSAGRPRSTSIFRCRRRSTSQSCASRSRASASVSSFFAKQKRAMRWSKPSA